MRKLPVIFTAMILVTGGTGFIGSNLVGALAERGERVSISDTLGSGEKWRNIARHEIDELVDPGELDDFFTRRGDEVRFVYHLGAVSATTETNCDLIASTNLGLSQKIWRWCSENRVPLVYASSAATYGAGENGFVDADDRSALARLRPLNPYGWSKHAFDRWVARKVDDGRAHPPHWAGLKFFNVYGPNEYHKGEMMSVVTKAYPGAAAGDAVTLFRSHDADYDDGGQMRDFVYVRDCVDVMTWLRDSPPADGLYNVGTGRAQSWLELMAALYDSVDRTLEVKWIDTPEEIRDRYQYFTQADISKLRDAGYDKPFASVEEGVSNYVERYLGTDDPYR
jgi:ADP-L-glycero-D-manno-heptose 6-epimerase